MSNANFKVRGEKFRGDMWGRFFKNINAEGSGSLECILVAVVETNTRVVCKRLLDRQMDTQGIERNGSQASRGNFKLESYSLTLNRRHCGPRGLFLCCTILFSTSLTCGSFVNSVLLYLNFAHFSLQTICLEFLPVGERTSEQLWPLPRSP